MDKEIVSLLNQLLEEQKKIDLKIDRIEKKLDSIVKQTEDLIKIKTIVSSKLEDIKYNTSNFKSVTAGNGKDIAKFKTVK